jgi:predicted DNA binding CopG/RHH family protein
MTKKDKDLLLKKAIIESNKEIINNNNIPNEEGEYIESLKNTTINDLTIREDLLEMFLSADKEYKKTNLKRDDTMTIRVNSQTIDKIKAMAGEIGMSYQSYINLFLFQLANNKFKIKIEANK